MKRDIELEVKKLKTELAGVREAIQQCQKSLLKMGKTSDIRFTKRRLKQLHLDLKNIIKKLEKRNQLELGL